MSRACCEHDCGRQTRSDATAMDGGQASHVPQRDLRGDLEQCAGLAGKPGGGSLEQCTSSEG